MDKGLTQKEIDLSLEMIFAELDDRLNNQVIQLEPGEFTTQMYVDAHSGLSKSTATKRLQQAVARGILTRRYGKQHKSIFHLIETESKD